MWDYADSARLVTAESIYSSNCIYCRSALYQMPSVDFHLPDMNKSLLAQMSVCPRCGWWSVFRVHQGEIPRTADFAESYSGAIGALKELDLSDISAPLTEVRGYLLAKPDAVFAAHPRLIEDVVGSIFKSQGWEAVVTAYSRDGGIDVFLRDHSGGLVGVQVKRYAESRIIEAEQIRSLAGALLLARSTAGVFVTTSSYRSGARKAADSYRAIGIPIELIDGQRLFELLEITQHKESPITADKINRYLLTSGIHLGTGVRKEFSAGEDLRDREIVVSIWLPHELVDTSNSPAPLAS